MEVDVNELMEQLVQRDEFADELERRHYAQIHREMKAKKEDGEGEPILYKHDGTPFLMNCLGIEELLQLKNIFLADPEGKVTKEDFENLIDKYCERLKLTKLQFRRIYYMIDLDSVGSFTWSNFISYLDQELKERAVTEKGTPTDPENLPIQGQPDFIDNQHSHVISSVAFWPTLGKDRKLDYSAGRFITTSPEGFVDFWNLNMKHLYSAKARSAVSQKMSTCITKILPMTDLNLICVCTMDRELRFYDARSDGFRLRTVINDFREGLVSMEYHFYDTDDIKSWLAVGDTHGNIIVLTFSPNAAKVIFGQVIGLPYVSVRFQQILLGALAGLHIHEFPNIHPTWIESMTYHEEFFSLLTTCNSPTSAVVLLNIHSNSILVKLDVSPGVTCAAKLSRDNKEELDESDSQQKEKRFSHLLVTAGYDTEIKIWDLDKPSKPKAVIEGKTPMIVLVAVDEGHHKSPWIYTYSRVGIITVWNARSRNCIQVYNGLTEAFGPNSQLATCYNPHFKLLVVAAFKICALKLGKTFDTAYSAGHCQEREITVCLYNYLYDVIVTAGADSAISTWHAFTGQKVFSWTKAHSMDRTTGTVCFGITTGTFNPTHSLLATGAMDGSIKMWNFHTGTCLRRMEISHGPVLQVIWLQTKFFGIGFESSYREWAPTIKSDLMKELPKKWHRTVTAACFLPPVTIIMGDVFGELLFCNYNSGKVYKRYYVHDPFTNLTNDIDYALEAKCVRNVVFNKKNHFNVGSVATASIHFIYYLRMREQEEKEGNVLVSLDTGMIQVWSAHPQGRLVTAFHAVHRVDDFVVRMVADRNNFHLFTGSADGYLKLWLLQNFATSEKSEISLPQLRLDYAFLAKTRWTTRAKRGVQDQPEPLLLNSYRAHGMAITSIIFIDYCQLVITAGADKCVRYWSMTGQFLNQLGSVLPWTIVDPSLKVVVTKLRIPSDLKRVMSSTTMKVLTNGYRLSEDGLNEIVSTELKATSHIKRRSTKMTPHGRALDKTAWKLLRTNPSQTKPAVWTAIDKRQIDVLGQMTPYKMEKIKMIDMPLPLQRKMKHVFMDSLEFSGAPIYNKSGVRIMRKQPNYLENIKNKMKNQIIINKVNRLVEEDLHPYVYGCNLQDAIKGHDKEGLAIRMEALSGTAAKYFEEPMGKYLWTQKRFETDAEKELKQDRMREMANLVRAYKKKEAERAKMETEIEKSREYLSNNLLTKKLRSGRIKDTVVRLGKLEDRMAKVVGADEEAEGKRMWIQEKMDKLKEAALHDLKVDQMKTLGGNFWKPLFTSSDSDVSDDTQS